MVLIAMEVIRQCWIQTVVVLQKTSHCQQVVIHQKLISGQKELNIIVHPHNLGLLQVIQFLLENKN